MRPLPLLALLLAAAVALDASRGDPAEEAPATGQEKPQAAKEPAVGKEARKEQPAAFKARGRLTCLAEEMKDRYGANVAPIHDHILGLRLEGEIPAGSPAYHILLRTPISEGLFADERHRAPSLLVTGRVFPGSSVVEVTNYQWIRDGKLIDVYYWCDICSIRGSNPGACACCQGQVELRESPSPEPLPK